MKKDVLHQKLTQARWRGGLNLFFSHLGVVAMVLGGVAMGWIGLVRLFAVTPINNVGVWGLGLISLVVVLVWWGLTFPTLTQAALLLDERFNLKERCITLLSLSQGQDSFIDNAYQEALPHLEGVVPGDRIRICLGRHWWGVLGIWVLAGGLYGLLPQQDWLGRLRQQEQRQQQEAQQAQVEATIRKSASLLAAQAQLAQTDLNDELAQLNAALKQADPNLARTQAIRSLGDMAEKVQRESALNRQTHQQLQKMLRQLRGTPEALSQQLSSALAQGKLNQAAALTRQLQQQLQEGQLSEQQRHQLQQQLSDLARQLDQLAQQRREQMAQELNRMGLDPKLAQMSPQQARQAMQKAGLSSQQIEQMMQKMSASQSAAASASQLAQAMGGAAGGGLGDLSQMIEALDQMDAFEQQGAMSAAMLAQLRQSIQAMGQGQGNRPGWGQGGGFSDQEQEGIGSGAPSGYSLPEDEPVTYQKTKSQSQTEEGPMVASWYFQGESVKGQAQRPLQQVVTEAAQQAAEAVQEHRIPKKYEAAVKGYFGQLQQNSDTEETPASEPSTNP